MEQCKYIIFNNNNAVIIPCTMSHSDFRSPSITSAGFVNLDLRVDEENENNEDFVFIYTYGESITLGLKSKQEDAVLICKTLNGLDSHRDKAFKVYHK